MSEARLFVMVRNADETGVSGTGVVLDGIEFPNGMVAVCWRSKTPSVNVYRSFVEFKHVHIDAHPTNGTEILWGEQASTALSGRSSTTAADHGTEPF